MAFILNKDNTTTLFKQKHFINYWMVINCKSIFTDQNEELFGLLLMHLCSKNLGSSVQILPGPLHVGVLADNAT